MFKIIAKKPEIEWTKYESGNDCTGVEYLKIPIDIKYIERREFAGLKNLKAICFECREKEKRKVTVAGAAFKNCPNLRHVLGNVILDIQEREEGKQFSQCSIEKFEPKINTDDSKKITNCFLHNKCGTPTGLSTEIVTKESVNKLILNGKAISKEMIKEEYPVLKWQFLPESGIIITETNADDAVLQLEITETTTTKRSKEEDDVVNKTIVKSMGVFNVKTQAANHDPYSKHYTLTPLQPTLTASTTFNAEHEEFGNPKTVIELSDKGLTELLRFTEEELEAYKKDRSVPIRLTKKE